MAIIALLVGILLPTLGEARRLGRKATCSSNLKQFGIAYSNYATDFQDRSASFTWLGGDSNSEYADLTPGPGTAPVDAAAMQAIAIIRRRTDITNFPLPTAWIPHILYNHLVLNDYLQQRLPERMVICPEDKPRVSWQEDVIADPVIPFNRFQQDPTRPPNDRSAPPNNYRWPFSSSYQVVPPAFAPDSGGGGITTVSQQDGNRHFEYTVGNAALGRRKLGDVDFPSQKSHMYDGTGRHFGKRDWFYAYPECVQPMLFFDTSVREYKTSEANVGFRPNTPAGPQPSAIRYEPSLEFESPTRSGQPFQTVLGYYQWTRGGLKGIDFRGTEINTGQNP